MSSRSRSRSSGRSRSRSSPFRHRQFRSAFAKPPRSEDLFSVKVDGLNMDTREMDVKEKFDRFGEVADVFMPLDSYNKDKPRGFCFVRFVKEEAAQDAIDHYRDGFELHDKMLRVSKATPRPRPGAIGWDPAKRGRGGPFVRDDRYGRDSRDRFGRRDSRDRYDRRDSRDRYGRRDSRDRYGRRDERDRYARRDSRDRNDDRYRRDDRSDRYGRDSGRDDRYRRSPSHDEDRYRRRSPLVDRRRSPIDDRRDSPPPRDRSPERRPYRDERSPYNDRRRSPVDDRRRSPAFDDRRRGSPNGFDDRRRSPARYRDSPPRSRY